MLFCAFGSVAPPCPFDPSPLPPTPLLLRLHSPRIPLALRLFFPFAFRSHSVFIPSITLCVSGCRGVGSGVSGRGCRVGGVGSGVSGRLCSPCPSPPLMRTDKESRVSKTLLSFHIVDVSFLSCPHARVYARPHAGEEKSPEFLAGQRLMSFSFGNSTAVLLYRSTHYRSKVSIKQFSDTIIILFEHRF